MTGELIPLVVLNHRISRKRYKLATFRLRILDQEAEIDLGCEFQLPTPTCGTQCHFQPRKNDYVRNGCMSKKYQKISKSSETPKPIVILVPHTELSIFGPEGGGSKIRYPTF